MGRPLRRHEPGTYYLVTTRCHQARFFLRPDPGLNQAVLQWISRAQHALPDVHLLAVCAMSNHLHLLVHDTSGRLAAWASYFLGNLARAVNHVRERRGVVFERRYSAEPILDNDALSDRLLYVLANPVQAGLCNQVKGWPGVLLWAQTHSTTPQTREVTWLDRPALRRAQANARRSATADPHPAQFRASGTITLHPLPAGPHGAALERAISDRERACAQQRAHHSQRVVSRAQLLRQDWRDAPKRPKRSPRPLVHTADRALRTAFLTAYRLFVDAFRTASERWRRGDSQVRFPLWSYPPSGALVEPLETG